MNTMNQRMEQDRNADPGLAPPKAGDRFRCAGCGMELQVTADCHCKEDEHVHFRCCGQEMTRV